MIKRQENGNGWYDAPMTVEELIKELQNYNPKAIVKMHMSSYNFEVGENRATETKYILSNEVASGVTGFPFEKNKEYNENEVWIYSKGLI